MIFNKSCLKCLKLSALKISSIYLLSSFKLVAFYNTNMSMYILCSYYISSAAVLGWKMLLCGGKSSHSFLGQGLSVTLSISISLVTLSFVHLNNHPSPFFDNEHKENNTNVNIFLAIRGRGGKWQIWNNNRDSRHIFCFLLLLKNSFHDYWEHQLKI